MPIDTNGEVDISTKIPRALFLLDSGGNEPEPLNLDLKIDFGSLQAPDAGATHSGAPRQRTPLRRSRRSPVSDKRISHLFGRQSESAVHSSARLDDPTEEPSSALVARIMYASDNPSPPPSPPALGSPKSLPGPSLGAPSLDTSGSTAPVIEHTEASVFQQHTFTAEEITTSLVLNANSGDSSPTSECEPDLINFSSFSNTPPPSIFVREKDSVDLVEDLLSPSTCNQDSGAHTLAEVGIRPNQPNIVGQDRAISPPSERQQETSCNTVFVDCVHGHSSPLIPPLDSSPKSPPNADSEPPLDSTQTKPVRRSSRQSQAPLRVPMPLVRSPTPRRPALTPLPNTMHSQVNLVVAETGTVPKVKEIGLPTQLQESDEGLVSANVGDQIRSNGEIRQPSPADTVIESHSGRKSRRKTKGNASSSAAELVSLSPSSTSILNDLFQSNSPPRVSSTINAVELTVHRPTTPPFPIVQTSSRPSTPQPVSPSKPADLTRTPARRIPIAEAIVQGTFSPQKPFSAVAGKLGIGQKVAAGRLNSPAFRRVPLDDPTRTPARRVPIAEASSAANSPSKGDILSLNHPVSRGAFPRSRSVELQPPIIQSKGRSASLEPPSRAHPLSFALRKKSSSQGESNTVELASLPFPIRPTASTSIPTIQEVGEEPELPRISSSPAKPTYALRQGSTSTESRIPRIGAKPYSRPTPKVPKTVAGNTNSKLSAPTSKPVKNGVSESWTAPATLTIRKATGRPTVISLDSPPQAGPGPTTAAARAMAKTVPASTSTLKRKREEESKVHPSDAKPLLAIRKVVSRKVPTVLDTEGVPSPVKSTLPVGTQPSRTNGKIHMRKVISKKIKEDVPTSQDDQLQGSSVSAVPPQTQVPFSQNVIIITDPTTDSVHDEPKPEELLPPPLPSEESSKRSTTPNTELTPAPSIPSSELETEVRPQSGIRRTTRARKASQPQTDVFGPTTPAPVPRSRRRAPAPSTDSGFAGLTALALRTLTSSNTARNQQQTVALTTEIIRIEGTRPDSPTTKVRTILEKQKELKVQQRQERAERRRKTAEGLLSEDTNDVDVISEVEDTSVLLMERDVDGIPLRHRMGPGEEEEYITPPRIERPFKRGRLEDGPEVIDEKRVKWDRGLSTTVYFDPSSPKPAKSSTEEINKKGCLTPATKTIRLDNMGNVLNANVPLLNLVHENVTVKKFVYDDDIEAQPPPPPRTTRSRAKKSKS